MKLCLCMKTKKEVYIIGKKLKQKSTDNGQLVFFPICAIGDHLTKLDIQMGWISQTHWISHISLPLSRCICLCVNARILTAGLSLGRKRQLLTLWMHQNGKSNWSRGLERTEVLREELWKTMMWPVQEPTIWGTKRRRPRPSCRRMSNFLFVIWNLGTRPSNIPWPSHRRLCIAAQRSQPSRTPSSRWSRTRRLRRRRCRNWRTVPGSTPSAMY